MRENALPTMQRRPELGKSAGEAGYRAIWHVRIQLGAATAGEVYTKDTRDKLSPVNLVPSLVLGGQLVSALEPIRHDSRLTTSRRSESMPAAWQIETEASGIYHLGSTMAELYGGQVLYLHIYRRLCYPFL